MGENQPADLTLVEEHTGRKEEIKREGLSLSARFCASPNWSSYLGDILTDVPDCPGPLLMHAGCRHRMFSMCPEQTPGWSS